MIQLPSSHSAAVYHVIRDLGSYMLKSLYMFIMALQQVSLSLCSSFTPFIHFQQTSPAVESLQYEGEIDDCHMK